MILRRVARLEVGDGVRLETDGGLGLWRTVRGVTPRGARVLLDVEFPGRVPITVELFCDDLVEVLASLRD